MGDITKAQKLTNDDWLSRLSWRGSIVALVSDCLARLFPDIFLWVQVGATGWEVNHIELLMGFYKLMRFSLVPWGAISQQQNRPSQKATGDILKEVDRVFTV